MELRLESGLRQPGVPPIACTSVVGGPIACSFPPGVNAPSVAFRPDSLHRSCFALRRDEKGDLADGSSTYEGQWIVIGRHRTAAQLVAPALAASPQNVTAGCYTVGSYSSRFAIEGAAVRVTPLPASPGYTDSALVPFDAQGIGFVVLPGDQGGLEVAVSGPTLFVSRTGNLGDCRAAVVLP